MGPRLCSAPPQRKCVGTLGATRYVVADIEDVVSFDLFVTPITSRVAMRRLFVFFFVFTFTHFSSYHPRVPLF